MRQILLFIFILMVPAKIFACECPEYNLKELDKVSYDWSDIILIGNIATIGTEYQIEIREVLKGEIKDVKIVGLTIGENELFNNCTFYPSRKGEYLLYLKKVVIDEKTYYYSSECLGCRLLSMEYYPPSLLSEKSKDELIMDTSIWIKELRKRRE